MGLTDKLSGIYKKAKSFTLVELLVVMGVIVVLAGTLVPIIASTRKSAARAVQMNNFNKLIPALKLYDGDYGIPPPDYTLNPELSIYDSHRFVDALSSRDKSTGMNYQDFRIKDIFPSNTSFNDGVSTEKVGARSFKDYWESPVRIKNITADGTDKTSIISVRMTSLGPNKVVGGDPNDDVVVDYAP